VKNFKNVLSVSIVRIKMTVIELIKKLEKSLSKERKTMKRQEIIKLMHKIKEASNEDNI
tara:strand:- start:8663 stop:8839 length:177 start_codon:yes stop_codon:yes gene_type:complete